MRQSSGPSPTRHKIAFAGPGGGQRPSARADSRENLALATTLALVGEFSLAADAIAGIWQFAPKVVLVDLGLPDAGGLEWPGRCARFPMPR